MSDGLQPPQSPKFVIHWRNLSNWRTGIGTTEFSEGMANTLANQLNQDYPEIEHVAVPVGGKAEFKSADQAPGLEASDPIDTSEDEDEDEGGEGK